MRNTTLSVHPNHKKACFLKEIGITKHFVTGKSVKIDPIGKLVYKRHLPIFSQFLVKPKQEKNLKISLGFPPKKSLISIKEAINSSSRGLC